MNGNYRHLMHGLLYSFVSLGVLIVAISLVLWLSNMKLQTLSSLIYFLHGICLLIGGFIAGKRILSKGWYYGGIVGIIYCTIIILVGLLGFESSLNLSTFLLFILSFSSGAIGGMVGVNTNN